MTSKIIDELHIVEIEVLRGLARTRKGGTVKDLKETLKMNRDRLSKGVQLLSDHGLIDVKKEKTRLIKLKPKVKDVIEKGLPERRLLNALKKPMNIRQIAKRVELNQKEFNIALGLLKKRVLIKIEKGNVSLSNKGKISASSKLDEEILLERIEDNNSADKLPDTLVHTLKNMVARGLLTVEEKKIRRYEINKKGIDIAGKIKSTKSIDQLNSKIIHSGEWTKKDVRFRRYNVNSKVPPLFMGKKQPYLAFLDKTKNWLVSRGFMEMEGPLVETTFWNSDALFMPQNHPARGIHDIFFVKNPKTGKISDKGAISRVKKVHEQSWKTKFTEETALRLILRSQGTAISARTSAGNPKIPGKYFAIARVFRPDVLDATHLIEFNHAEGIILGKNLNFRNLLGVLRDYAMEVAGADEVWFKPGYFPFTEPSVEMFARLGKRWIELGGAGLFRPEVVKPLVGKDVQVIAWGLGIDRMFMIKNKIEDIRYLFSQDIKWLRDSKVM